MKSQHQMQLIAFADASSVQVRQTDIQAGDCQVTASACQINPASSAFACACHITDVCSMLPGQTTLRLQAGT